MHRNKLTIGQTATLACLLEVSAPKPGNVHRGADFEDLTLNDFLISAVAIEPQMEAAAAGVPLGECILEAVKATQRLVATNTNLGMVLLIAPLAAATIGIPIQEGIQEVLAELTAEDAQNVYEAIRLAKPGGMGDVDELDLAGPAPGDLMLAMRTAAERDLIARQYVNNFHEVFTLVVPWLAEGKKAGLPLTTNLVHVYLKIMSQFPDSLILRKCGAGIAAQSAELAKVVLEAGKPDEESYRRALSDLDFWLRNDHHRRNPGTSADLLAAGLFVALRNEIITPPFH